MSKNTDLHAAWTQFINSWLETAEKTGYPKIEPDSDWPSPCEFEVAGEVYWKPVLINEHSDKTFAFDNVEEALGVQLNKEYTEYFSMYFADGVNAIHDKGPFQFLQAWSEDDFDRLQQNLIGHLLMKDKLKQSPTLFFAVTDEDDLNLVVDNETGNVCLEYVGKEPHEVIASSLSEFIRSAKPAEAQ